tara:strand:- start:149 stop:292 length:144 start_codon:yes stop_codon:yes gene_type:complete
MPEDNLFKRLGLEIRRPSRQTVGGFIVAWVCVLAIVLLTVWLTGIGA